MKIGLVRQLKIWYRASRPFTLSASAVPVLVGSSLALQEGRFSPGLFILVLLASVLVQVTTNLVDEYSDHSRPEGKEKLLAPYKVIALGLLSSTAVRRGAAVCFGVAAAIGIFLTIVVGWPILVICLASAAVAYFYSASPRPLGTIGLGQPLVFIFMGPVMVLGAYYVHTQTFTLPALWLSLPVGFTVTAILAANDLRDLEEDRTAGKTTVVTLLGRRFGRWEWTFLVAAAYLGVIIMAVTGLLHPLALVALLTLPWAVATGRAVWREGGRVELALALRMSARLHGYFGLLLAAGVVIGRFIS